MSARLPPVRSEFEHATSFGRVERLRRYEVAPPNATGDIRGISEAVGCSHARRASVIARVGGGHLLALLPKCSAESSEARDILMARRVWLMA